MDPTTAITGQHPVVISAVMEQKIAMLEADIQDLRDQNNRQSTFQRWLIGILVGVGLTIGGTAYSAYGVLATRVVEVGTETNVKLAMLFERLDAINGRLDREVPRSGP
jgi:hypothetical protein